MRLLQSYNWPGNVRELQNATERALILAQQGVLQFDLPIEGLLHRPETLANGEQTVILTDLELRLREKENMLAALNKAGWRINGEGGAAELLE
jgi:transcriptional regulator of acetoin/glycerol metabolism